MPKVADRTGLKDRLERVYALRGSYAAAGDALGVNRQQMRQYLKQVGGFVRSTRELLEPALDRFEDENAEQIERFELSGRTQSSQKTLHNPPIPNIAHDVLRYMLDAVKARSNGGAVDA